MVWIYVLCWISELLQDIIGLFLDIFATIKKSLCKSQTQKEIERGNRSLQKKDKKERK
jgi:hypothetical protein